MTATAPLDRKRVQQLEKLFKTEAEREAEASKRIQVLSTDDTSH
jgi:hypothetical protein